MAYQFESKIRYSEVGEDRKLTLVSLADYFQDCAIFHTEDCGLGLDYMADHHCLWVVVFWQIDILRMPLLGELVTVRTIPYEFKAFYGNRNFVLLDEEGKNLAIANSVWALIDSQTDEPIRATQEMIDRYGTGPKLEMEYLPRKISMKQKGERMEPFFVAKHYIDTNNHVNNGAYIRMAQEYLPEDFETSRLCVEYCRQAHLYDEIVPEILREPDAVTVRLLDRDEKPYAIVKNCR